MTVSVAVTPLILLEFYCSEGLYAVSAHMVFTFVRGPPHFFLFLFFFFQIREAIDCYDKDAKNSLETRPYVMVTHITRH